MGTMALNRTVTRSKAHVSIPPPCLCSQFYTGHEIESAFYTEPRFVCVCVCVCVCVSARARAGEEPIYNLDNKRCGHNNCTGVYVLYRYYN